VSSSKSSPEPTDRLPEADWLFEESGDQACPGLAASEVDRLYAEVGPGLRAFLRSLLGSEADAADCLQECFAALVQRGGQCKPAARKAWLYTIGRNQAAWLIRRRQAGQRALQTASHNRRMSNDNHDAASAILKNERQAQVQAAVRRLSPEQQLVVKLRIDDDFTFREIALQLQIPLGTALSRMRAALKCLAEELNETQDMP